MLVHVSLIQDGLPVDLHRPRYPFPGSFNAVSLNQKFNARTFGVQLSFPPLVSVHAMEAYDPAVVKSDIPFFHTMPTTREFHTW